MTERGLWLLRKRASGSGYVETMSHASSRWSMLTTGVALILTNTQELLVPIKPKAVAEPSAAAAARVGRPSAAAAAADATAAAAEVATPTAGGIAARAAALGRLAAGVGDETEDAAAAMEVWLDAKTLRRAA